MTLKFAFRSLLAIATGFASPLLAQDIHYTQVNATPLTVNPAFTGMFSGAVRVSAIYRNQWQAQTVPYTTTGVSFDMSVARARHSYLGLGAQIFSNQEGDGDAKNVNGIISVSYHRLFGIDSTGTHGCDLAIGAQAGYAQYTGRLDASGLYFGHAPVGEAPFYLLYGNTFSYINFNSGISFSQLLGSKLNYTIGFAVNNIDNIQDKLQIIQNEVLGINMRYTGELNINWQVAARLSIHPAIIVISNNNYNAYLTGSEFRYNITKSNTQKRQSTSIFAGLWSRSGHVGMVTAGIQTNRVRIGASLDYAAAGNTNSGGFEVMCRYIAPGHHKAQHQPARSIYTE